MWLGRPFLHSFGLGETQISLVSTHCQKLAVPAFWQAPLNEVPVVHTCLQHKLHIPNKFLREDKTSCTFLEP